MAEKRVSVRLAAVGGKQVRAELEGVGDAGVKGFGRMSKEAEIANARLAAFSTRVKIAAAVAVAAAAAAGIAMIRSGLETIDAQANLAQSLGTTTRSIQVLTFAGDLAGVSMEEIAAATKKLTLKLSDAAGGTGTAVDALQRLHLTATDLRALPLDERIVAIQDALTKFVPPAERAAVASALFGDKAALAFSRIDSATLRQASQDITDFGVAVSDQDADQIRTAGDAIDRLGLVWLGLTNQLTVAVAPALETVANALADATRVGGVFQTSISFLGDHIGEIASIAGAFATFFAGRFVIALGAAALGVGRFSLSLTVLKGALIRTGIGARGWEQRTGQRLRFVYRRGQPSLLVAETRLNSKGGRVQVENRSWAGNRANLPDRAAGEAAQTTESGRPGTRGRGAAAGADRGKLEAGLTGLKSAMRTNLTLLPTLQIFGVTLNVRKGGMSMMGGNKDQAEYWVSPPGLKWIKHEHALDAAMVGMLDTILDAAQIEENERVIDIGCGTGASTLAAAAIASQGHVLGVDISAPLLNRARSRASSADKVNVSFLEADAQSYGFEKDAFDVLISRIGMMFFVDPVKAFQNLLLSIRSGGRMVFVCWSSVAQNPWFHIPNEAAVSRLGGVPKGDPHAPGPTAFQDIDYVKGLMEKASLTDVKGSPVEIDLTPPNGLQGAARVASRVGPAARIMKAHSGSSADATAIEDAVRDAFRQFEKNGTVIVPAVVNLFTCSI